MASVWDKAKRGALRAGATVGSLIPGVNIVTGALDRTDLPSKIIGGEEVIPGFDPFTNRTSATTTSQSALPDYVGTGEMLMRPSNNNTTPTPTTPGPVLDTAAINAAQAQLAELPGLRERQLAADEQRFKNTMGRFDTQE